MRYRYKCVQYYEQMFMVTNFWLFIYYYYYYYYYYYISLLRIHLLIFFLCLFHLSYLFYWNIPRNIPCSCDWRIDFTIVLVRYGLIIGVSFYFILFYLVWLFLYFSWKGRAYMINDCIYSLPWLFIIFTYFVMSNFNF